MEADRNDNEAMGSGDADASTAAAAAKEDAPAAMDANGDDDATGGGGADDAPTSADGKAEGDDRDEERDDAGDSAAEAVPGGDYRPPRAWAAGGICLPIASFLALVSLGPNAQEFGQLIELLGPIALAVPVLLATGLLVFYLILLFPLSCFRDKMRALRSEDPDAAGRRPSALALRVLDAWFTCNVWALLAASAAISLAIAISVIVAFVQSTSEERCAFADGVMTADTGTYGSSSLEVMPMPQDDDFFVDDDEVMAEKMANYLSPLEVVPHDDDRRVLVVGDDDVLNDDVLIDDDDGILFSEDDVYGRDDCDYSLLSKIEDYSEFILSLAFALSQSAAMLYVGFLVLRYIRPRAREEGGGHGDGPTEAADGAGLELPDRAETTEAEGEESGIPAIV